MEPEILQAYQDALALGREPSKEVLARLGAAFATERAVVVAWFRRQGEPEERAEELAQETLIIAHAQLGAFEGRSRFRTWVLGVAKNLHRNARRRKQDVLTEDGVVEASDVTRPLLYTMMSDERAELVVQAAADLAPEERQVVQLRYVDGLTVPQIDAELGLTGSGARAILQRCQRKLRQRMLELLADKGHRASTLFLL